MSSPPRLTPAKRIELISRLADTFYGVTETWHGRLGTQLAYLFVAIARGTQVELTRRECLARLMCNTCPDGDPVWGFIVWVN